MLNSNEIQKIQEQFVQNHTTLVVDGFIVNDDRNAILLQKRSPDRRQFPNCWDAIGGHVDEGEDLLTALKREMKEESDMDLTGVISLSHHFEWPEDSDVMNFQFLVTAEGEFVPEEGKITEARWITEADLPEILDSASGAMKVGIRKAFDQLKIL